MEINRIIEIDADSSREDIGESYMKIRYVNNTNYPRSRQPTSEPNLKADIAVLTEALGSLVIQAEKEGVLKIGEGIRFAIDNLNKLYVSAEAEVTNTDDNEGTFKASIGGERNGLYKL